MRSRYCAHDLFYCHDRALKTAGAADAATETACRPAALARARRSPRLRRKRFNLSVEHQHARLLVDSEVVRVVDVTCWAPRSGYGAMMFNAAAQIAVPRRGVFVLERCGQRAVVDTNTVVLLGIDDEYRVSHPADGGDDGTVFSFAPALVEEAVGGVAGRVGQLQPRQQLAARIVTHALAESKLDRLEAEDATLLLLASLRSAFATHADTDNERQLGPAQRLRVDRARALLASSPAKRWDLSSLAEALGCSPFHLARQFRAATGETISRYMLRLRLAMALDRLADGERDLAALAVAVGFSHHSHFTARFRTAFGITPKHAREILTRRNLEEFRSLAVVADRRGRRSALPARS